MKRLEFDREELAWAAGFFDGEGCFCFSEAGQYVCVSITQTEREPLDRFERAVGLGKVNGPYGSIPRIDGAESRSTYSGPTVTTPFSRSPP